MSDNFADFLNDNAGVVGATAGYAVNRNIAATNRNISALRGELGKLQERFAQEQRKEERERLNRDMLFQISQQVDAVNAAPTSPELYFELVRVSEDFQRLGFTSATFNSLEDKTFLSKVSSSIDQSFNTLWESFPDETREQIAEVVDWNYLREMGDSVAIADKKIPSTRTSFEGTLSKAETLQNSVPRLFSNKILNGVMISTLLLGILFIILASNAGPKADEWVSSEMIKEGWGDERQVAARESEKTQAAGRQMILLLLGMGSFGTSAIVFIVVMTGLDPKRKKHASESIENSQRSHRLREQLVFLQSHRASFAEKLSQLQRVPPDTIAFLTSDTVKPQERFAQIDQVSAHLNDLCSNLGIDPQRLPTVPERKAMGGLLASRV